MTRAGLQPRAPVFCFHRLGLAAAEVIISSMSTIAAGRGRMDVMPRPSAAGPSTRLLAAAEADRERIDRELGRVAQRTEAVIRELHELIELREELRQQLALLDQLAQPEQLALGHVEESDAEDEERPEAPPPNGFLRGARIRSVAVRLLAASEEAHQPVHYTRWFEILRRAGFGIAGQDPLATFLTQIARSPAVARVDAPGMYILDLDSPARLHGQLRGLQEELVRLHEGQQTLDGVTSVRERRTQIVAEIARTERGLEEVLSALGVEPASLIGP